MQTIAFLLQEHVSIVRREREILSKMGPKKFAIKYFQLNWKKKSSFSREISPIYA
jgi:hypothetical protein